MGALVQGTHFKSREGDEQQKPRATENNGKPHAGEEHGFQTFAIETPSSSAIDGESLPYMTQIGTPANLMKVTSENSRSAIVFELLDKPSIHVVT